MTACPVCKSPTLPANDGREQFCPQCWSAFGRDEGQMPLVGAEIAVRGSRGARRAHPEAALVADIVKALRACGRTVLRCGQWRADLAGQTQGTPDLFVWCLFAVPYSPTGCMGAWVGLEVKTAKGRVSPAQKKLADEGKTFVIHSIAEAFKAVGERL